MESRNRLGKVQNLQPSKYEGALALTSDESFSPPVMIRVTTAGDVKFDALDGGTCTLPCAAFEWIPVQVTKVYSSSNGTNASGLHAFS